MSPEAARFCRIICSHCLPSPHPPTYGNMPYPATLPSSNRPHFCSTSALGNTDGMCPMLPERTLDVRIDLVDRVGQRGGGLGAGEPVPELHPA